MGIRVSFEQIEAAAPRIRRLGIRRIEYADDGSIRAVEFVQAPVRPNHDGCDAHDEAPVDAECAATLVARELRWLRESGLSPR